MRNKSTREKFLSTLPRAAFAKTVSNTRPSNLLAYTAGDVIGSNGGIAPASATATISTATPGVVTWGGGSPSAHGMSAGQAVIFKTAAGTIAAGLTDDTIYYVVIPEANPTTTFNLSDTKAHALAGTDLIATTAGTGTTTCAKVGSAIWTFPEVGAERGITEITQSGLMILFNQVGTTRNAFRAHLYSQSPPSAFLDNDAWSVPAADQDYYRGYVDLGVVIDVGDVLFIQATLAKRLVLDGPDLFVYLQAITGYTPASGEVTRLTLFGSGL